MLRFYYSGDFSSFSYYKERQNISHRLGFIVSPVITENKTLNIGGSIYTRRNEGNYIYYNTDFYNLYASFRYEPDVSKIYTLGLNYEKSKFREFEEI